MKSHPLIVALVVCSLLLGGITFAVKRMLDRYEAGRHEYVESDFAENMVEVYVPAYYLREHQWPTEFSWVGRYFKWRRNLPGGREDGKEYFESDPVFELTKATPSEFSFTVKFRWPHGSVIEKCVLARDLPDWAADSDLVKLSKLIQPAHR